jgi:hypothetical protein
MAKYVRTSKRLQRFRVPRNYGVITDRELRHREEMLCCFLPAIQESTSLKELHIYDPGVGRPTYPELTVSDSKLSS